MVATFAEEDDETHLPRIDSFVYGVGACDALQYLHPNHGVGEGGVWGGKLRKSLEVKYKVFRRGIYFEIYEERQIASYHEKERDVYGKIQEYIYSMYVCGNNENTREG